MGILYFRLGQAPEKAQVVEGIISINRACSLHPGYKGEWKGNGHQGKSHLYLLEGISAESSFSVLQGDG